MKDKEIKKYKLAKTDRAAVFIDAANLEPAAENNLNEFVNRENCL